MLSIICPVRPNSTYIEGFLSHLLDNIEDKSYVEVLLGVNLGDTEILEKIEPFRQHISIRTIEMDKSMGRKAFHTWLTFLSYASKGWALVFLSDDIRPEGKKLDVVFRELEDKFKDEATIFYLNGMGAYPSMTKVWFDKYGWGPHYGVDTFLNSVTALRPDLKLDVSGINPKDLGGITGPDSDYKVMDYPSKEFDMAVADYLNKINENSL